MKNFFNNTKTGTILKYTAAAVAGAAAMYFGAPLIAAVTTKAE